MTWIRPGLPNNLDTNEPGGDTTILKSGVVRLGQPASRAVRGTDCEGGGRGELQQSVLLNSHVPPALWPTHRVTALLQPIAPACLVAYTPCHSTATAHCPSMPCGPHTVSWHCSSPLPQHALWLTHRVTALLQPTAPACLVAHTPCHGTATAHCPIMPCGRHTVSQH